MPTIEAYPAVNVTSTSATLSFNVLDDGDSAGDAAWTAKFGYMPSSSSIWTWTEVIAGSGEGTYLQDVTGLFPDTEYYAIVSVTNSAGTADGYIMPFTTLIQETPVEPEYPDPNAIPVPFNSNEPNSILIENYAKVFFTDSNKPHDKQGLFRYMEDKGNFNEIDANDVFYTVPVIKSTKIVSLIPIHNLKGEITGFDELSKDARPGDPNIALLELSIYSPKVNEPNISSENYLKFWLPNDANSAALNNIFGGKPLTIQQVSDSNDPNLVYPLWDIRKIIDKNGRQLPLNNLVNQKPNTGYAYFTLSTDRELLDINEDRKIDSNDYALLSENFGKTGIFRSDISGEKGPGLPDGKVDAADEAAFITKYNELYPDNPIPNPYGEFSESFEGGFIQEPFTTSGNSPWIIDSYSGNYCVKSGSIKDNQKSVLAADIDTPSGWISFSRKVSCESDFDFLGFYIDGIEAGRWSGIHDWQEMNFQTTPGTHNFKWIYKKDSSDKQGDDAAWIDDINLK